MTISKQEWEESIRDLRLTHFQKVRDRYEAEGMDHIKASLVAYQEVYRQEGK